MPQALLCPICGKTVPGDAPGEVCPACLMLLGLHCRDANEDKTLPPRARAPEPETVGPASQPSIRENGAPVAETIRIPGYEILGELGRGGMGVVYKARHLDLKRLVALKMIVGAEYASGDQIERFQREAEAVARLQHPNIVQIYEVGQREGRPYFSLEFVDGGSLADKLQGTPLPPAEAAHVVENLARAVHAAHQRGIVHRDLKPGNVLIMADGTPKIADFGLAKETDGSSSRTQEGTVVGTPSYMAPEQASGATRSVGPAADTYALGAILYETLTGRPPFKGVTSMDTIMQVVSLEPAAPRDLQPQVPRDLETICLKCLHKDSARRYDSALTLAEDLRRFLAGEPILARPTGSVERLVKWSRRRPMVAGLAASLMFMACTAFCLLLWRLQEADRASQESERAARAEREKTEKADELTKEAMKRLDAEALFTIEAKGKEQEAIKRAEAQKLAADAARGREQEANKRAEAEKLAAETERKRREEAAQFLETSQIGRAAGLIDSDPVKAQATLLDVRLCPPERRDFAWRYQYQQAQRLVRRLALHAGSAKDIIRDGALSPDGKVLATQTADNQVRLWDFVTGTPGLLLPANHRSRVMEFDARLVIGEGIHFVFSPDSKILATGGPDGLVKLWDVATGALTTTLKWDIPDDKEKPRMVEALAFHPSGKTLAVGGHCYDQEMARKDSDGRFRYFVVWVWDLASGTGKLLTSHAHPQFSKDYGFDQTGINALAYSPDGKILAMGITRGSAVNFLDAATGQRGHRFHQEPGFIGGMAFSPDGKLFAYGNTTSNAFLYERTIGQHRHTLYGHTNFVTNCVFTAEGALATGGFDGTIRIWDAGSGQMRTIFRCGGSVLRMFQAPGGQELIAVTPHEVQVWSMRDGSAPAVTLKFNRPTRGPSQSTVAFDESSARFAVAGLDDRILLYQLTRQVSVTLNEKRPAIRSFPLFDSTLFTAETGPAWFASVSAKADGALQGHKGKITAVAFGPAGSDMIVSAGEDRQILVWQVRDGKHDPPKVLSGHTATISRLAVSPDGKFIVSASWDQTVRVWDVAGGASTQPFAGDRFAATALTLTRDGKRLIVGDSSGRVRIWDFEKQALQNLPHVARPGMFAMSLTPDGKLAATVHLGVVTVHDLVAGTTRKISVPETAGRIALTPDGRTMALAGNDRVARLYDVDSGHLRCELPVLSHSVFGLGFNHDGTLLATISHGQARWDGAGEIKLWAAAPASAK